MASKPMSAGAPLVEMSEHGHHDVAALPPGPMPSRVLARARPEAMEAPFGPAMSRQRAAQQRQISLLAKTLEAQVLPRLLLSRAERAVWEHPDAAAASGPSSGDVEALASIVMQGDLAAAQTFMTSMHARQLPLERIYLELLAPVARHLGDLWSEDRCDFTSVTVGLCCLQQLVLENSHAFGPRPGRRDADRRILLAATPGEQHSFGLLMVGEFFRRQGWDVHSATGAPARELVALARKQWFSVVGFSLAGESRLDALSGLIRDIRRATRNPHLGVLVGGQVFTERPELAALVGADATASDGQQAVLKAETLLALLLQED
ncbi:cobalamin B12-binding domain-containing protein [Falsiroseomonas oryzae]|uniref:cobalamin B12-binding domain-containing protein n=1 Tax=Falsiroseomonas oryzae TaxID=2766473 RepID=UPI0022EA2FF3|nr:cobalamin B12-binding domain-containing protein [Roseomonas sp. MO-31]